MSAHWRVRLFVWPYESVKRGEDASYLSEDERRVRGASDATIHVEADDFEDAHRKARAIVQGVMLDERVWRAGITSIELGRAP